MEELEEVVVGSMGGVGDVCSHHYCISQHQKGRFQAQSNHPMDFCSNKGRLVYSNQAVCNAYNPLYRYNYRAFYHKAPPYSSGDI